MQVRRRFTVACLPLLLGVPWPLSAQPLHLRGVARPLPPLSFLHEGRVQGLFVEILQALCDPAVDTLSLEMQPLQRLARDAGAAGGRIVFPMDRKDDQADALIYVGPVVQRRVAIYKLSRRTDLSFGGLALLGDLRIGAARGTGTHKKLLDSGLYPSKQLELAAGYPAAIRMLLAGHIDFLAINELALAWHVRQLNLAPDTLSAVATLDPDGAYWFGLSPSEAAMASRLQQRLDQLRSSGRLDELKRRYGL